MPKGQAKDQELVAVNRVCKALEALPPERRKAVLDYIVGRLAYDNTAKQETLPLAEGK